MSSPQCHEASGASMPAPESFEGPEEFAAALFDANQQDGAISKERWIGLGHCLFALMREESSDPDRAVKQMVKQIAGPFAEGEKVKAATSEIMEKVSSEVIPFVAGELFDVLDRDRSKGISKDEIDFAITAAMSGPSAAFGMLFKAIDKDNSGSISNDELSQFSANIVRLIGKSMQVCINVISSTFKDDIADGATTEAFDNLDANSDGFLDKEELSMMSEGLEGLKQQLQAVSEMDMDGPAGIIFPLIENEIKKCAEAGDVDPDAFYNLFEDIMHKQVNQLQGVIRNEEMCPAPPELVEKLAPFVDTAAGALKSGFATSFRSVLDAYFNLLDANSDGIVQNCEMMSIIGVFDKDISAEKSFDLLFALVDTDGDGKISRDESVQFCKKVLDLAVATLKASLEMYEGVINAVAQDFFRWILQALCGGDEFTEDKFTEIAGAFVEDGPEVLLAPLMQ